MNKKAQTWKRLLNAGVKKDVFLQLLRERFPKGQFTFGDAIEAYGDAHNILHDRDAVPPPVGLTGVRDILYHEGALFEYRTHGRRTETEGREGGWPSTRRSGLITMPYSKRFKPLMQKVIGVEMAGYRRLAETWGGDMYKGHLERLTKELRSLR